MNLDQKLSILGIKPSEKDKIKSLPYESVYYPHVDFDENSVELQIINLDELVGMCRPDSDRVDNWLEAQMY
ncbi:hypothetical protein MTP04_08190 [Lysinibacillus sp. PLM2]|nr:hypothetical protein MTP04_08190 [Lysinibacillus sp. PLM2]